MRSNTTTAPPRPCPRLPPSPSGAVATIFQFSIALHLFRRKVLPAPGSPVALAEDGAGGAGGGRSDSGTLTSHPTLSDLLAHQRDGGLSSPQQVWAQQQQQPWRGQEPADPAAAGGLAAGSGGEVLVELQPAGAGSAAAAALKSDSPGGAARGTGLHQSPLQLGQSGGDGGPPSAEPSAEEAEEDGTEDREWLLGASHAQQQHPGGGSSGGSSSFGGRTPESAGGGGTPRGKWGGGRAAGEDGGAAPPRGWRERAGRLWTGARRIDWQAILPLPTQASIAGVWVLVGPCCLLCWIALAAYCHLAGCRGAPQRCSSGSRKTWSSGAARGPELHLADCG